MLSTFAMYFPEPRTPLSSDFELINAAGHIARIAIELERSHLALRTRKIDCEPSLTLFPRWLGLPVPTARPNSSTGAGWIMPAYRRKRHRIGAWTVALHPEDRDRLRDYWRHLLASGEAGEIEARLRRFDGKYRWFLFRRD